MCRARRSCWRPVGCGEGGVSCATSRISDRAVAPSAINDDATAIRPTVTDRLSRAAYAPQAKGSRGCGGLRSQGPVPPRMERLSTRLLKAALRNLPALPVRPAQLIQRASPARIVNESLRFEQSLKARRSALRYLRGQAFRVPAELKERAPEVLQGLVARGALAAWLAARPREVSACCRAAWQEVQEG